MNQVNETYCLLDIRGLVLRHYHGCDDKSIQASDRLVPAWQAALDDILKELVLPLLTRHAPRQIIAAWDAGNTYRLNVSPTYKSARAAKERDPAVSEQTKHLFEGVRNLFAGLGIKQVKAPGEEADDVIALLASRLAGTKMIYTVDQDLIALAGLEGVHVVRRVGRDEAIYSADSTFEGLPVRFVSLRKAMLGDSVDSYRGVPGFGPKAFETLFEAIGEAGLDWLQHCVEHDLAEQLKPYIETSKPIGLLYQKWHDFRIGWKLAKLEPNACYGAYRKAPKRPVWDARVPSTARLQPLLTDVGRFVSTDAYTYVGTMLEQVQRWLPTRTLIEASQADQLVALMPEVLASPVVSYDFESSDKAQHPNFRQNDKNYVDVLSQELAGISVNYGDNLQHTVYVSFDHLETENFPREWATWLLQSLDSRAEPCVVQNAAFELAVAQKNLGYMPRAPYDTRIMASYVDENEEAGLKAMSKRWFNFQQLTYAETTKGRRMDEMSGEDVLVYGTDDSLLTSHLFDLFQLIMQLEGSWDFYRTNEVMPAVDDAWSFLNGTLLDLDRMRVLRKENSEQLSAAEGRVHQALSQRPSEVEQASAQRLLEEWWLTEKYRYLSKPQDMADGYQALWSKAWAACLYTPSTRTESSVAFSPTPGDLNKVLSLMDPQAPKISKTTKKGLEEYDLELSTYLSGIKAGTDHHGLLSDFQSHLWEARADLAPNKRRGSAYERLQDFCQSVFDYGLPKKVTTTGTPLNFGSGPQMQGFLYGLLRLPVRRRSKVQRGSLRERERLVGSPSTGIKAVNAALVWDVTENDWRRPVLKDYEQICKGRQLESLYFSKYPNWVNPETGLLHPQINNCGTVTRRPTGNSPNMLQISKGQMRTMFPAGEGRVFVSMDVSNQELVILAAESRDPVMLEAFLSTPRKDIHSITSLSYAHDLLTRRGLVTQHRLSYEEFQAGLHSEDKRISEHFSFVRNKISKGVNFLLAYLGGYATLAENLQVSQDMAKALMDQTFKLYSLVQPWQQEVIEFARVHGYSEMAYGSRRHVSADIHSEDVGLRKRMERQAVNAVIQSTAAEILKVIRQRLVERQFRERYQLRSVFMIYDEITASVPLDLAPAYIMELAEVMRVTPPGYPVGMEVEAAIGYTWGKQVEIGLPSAEKITAAINKLSTLEQTT